MTDPDCASSSSTGGDGPVDRLRRLTGTRWFHRAETVLWVVVGIFLLLRLAPQIAALSGVSLPSPPAVVGSTPSWSVPTLEGGHVGSEALRGKVVVVNFWATWCPPCRVEIPSLQALRDDRGHEGLEVVGIATDRGDPAQVAAFLEERDITYPVGMEMSGLRDAFGGIPGLPTTFVLDREGVVRHRLVGYVAPPALRAAVGRLLTEP